MNRAGSYRPKLAIQKTYNLRADRDSRGLLYWEWWDTKGYGTSHLFFCRKTSSNTCCQDKTCITISSVDNNRQWTLQVKPWDWAPWQMLSGTVVTGCQQTDLLLSPNPLSQADNLMEILRTDYWNHEAAAIRLGIKNLICQSLRWLT
jgi:hypothetical protein